jgi:hypothetical protein
MTIGVKGECLNASRLLAFLHVDAKAKPWHDCPEGRSSESMPAGYEIPNKAAFRL